MQTHVQQMEQTTPAVDTTTRGCRLLCETEDNVPCFEVLVLLCCNHEAETSNCCWVYRVCPSETHPSFLAWLYNLSERPQVNIVEPTLLTESIWVRDFIFDLLVLRSRGWLITEKKMDKLCLPNFEEVEKAY